VSITAFYGVSPDGESAVGLRGAPRSRFIRRAPDRLCDDGKYYIARKPKRSWQNIEQIQCWHL